MADSVSPPPTEAREAVIKALRASDYADLIPLEFEWFIAEIVAAAVWPFGVAAGRTQAADYLDQRAQKIAATATSPADRGLAAGLANVARELREGQENT